MMKTGLLSLVTVFIAVCAATAQAGDRESGNVLSAAPARGDLFAGGRFEANLASGALFSPYVATKGRPGINYTLSELQLGYMLNDAEQRGGLRGNAELLGSVFGGTVFKGHGNYVSGSTLWLRFNLVPQFWRIVPYAQAGAGVTFTDIDRKIVGQTFNFNLNLGAGFRWFFARNWSVNLEHRSQERRYQFTGTDARNFVLLLTGVANYFAGSVSTAVSSSCSLMTGAMA